jgi:perosamine synthetase
MSEVPASHVEPLNSSQSSRLDRAKRESASSVFDAIRAPQGGIRYRLTEPYIPHPAAVVEALTAVVASNYYTQGPRVREFERAFAASLGRKYAIACNSGTSALHLAVDALKIETGDPVLLPAYTCVATVLPLIYARALPVYAERFGGSTMPSWNLTTADVESALRQQPAIKAAIPVAMYGEPLPEELFAACAQHGIPTIEDACEATGAATIGRYGTISCFSLRGDKMLTAGGTGGMAVTDDSELAKRMLIARDMYLHMYLPIEAFKRYDATGYGFSYEMAELQAAMGLVALPWLAESVRSRQLLHGFYQRTLSSRGVFEVIEHTVRSAVWRVAIRPADPALRNRAWRDSFIIRARAEGVELLPGFTPLSWLDNPDVEHELYGVFCVPCHPKLTGDDVETIVSILEGAMDPSPIA